MTDIKTLTGFCDSFQKLFCYGAGKYGKAISLYLLRLGLKIDAFLVSGTPEEDDIWAIPVISLAEINSDEPDTGIILCAGEASRKEMMDNLNNKGIENVFIVSKDLYIDLLRRNKYEYFGRPYNRNPRNKVLSLYYHRVANLSSDPWKMAVTPEEFEEHLRIVKNNYNVLRFEDSWDSINDLSVVLTFDDGYLDFYKNAFPLLEKYDIPATIFISTANIGKQDEFWWDKLERILWHSERIPKEIIVGNRTIPSSEEEEIKKALSDVRLVLKEQYGFQERKKFLDNLEEQCVGSIPADPIGRTMNRKEIKELSSSKVVTIGVHTITHPALGMLGYEEQKREIEEAKEELEKITGKTITTFSYPFGNYNETTPELVRNAGFVRARTIREEIVREGQDSMLIPGINAGPLKGDELMAKIAYYFDMFGDS